MGAAETGAAPIPSDTGRKLNWHVEPARSGRYKVVWRLGTDVGANSLTMQDPMLDHVGHIARLCPGKSAA